MCKYLKLNELEKYYELKKRFNAFKIDKRNFIH